LKREKEMKMFKYILILSIFLANLVFAQPSLADKPSFAKNPDYIEVTKELNKLMVAKDTQAQAESYTPPAEIQKKIDELEFQKYTLEAGLDWGQCRNETGKTLAVYGPKLDDDDDDNYSYENALYFLADGQTTKIKWDCDGFYIPSDVRVTGLSTNGQAQELSGSVAVKIPDGSNLVVKTNSEPGAVEFNAPLTKVFKEGEVNWFIPNVSQSVIDTRVPNAPTK
jgi:hypothetical protein